MIIWQKPAKKPVTSNLRFEHVGAYIMNYGLRIATMGRDFLGFCIFERRNRGF